MPLDTSPDKGHVNGNGPVSLSAGEVDTKEDRKFNEYGMRPGSQANRLGDVHSSDACSDCGAPPEDDDLAKEEAKDKSIEGSVY